MASEENSSGKNSSNKTKQSKSAGITPKQKLKEEQKRRAALEAKIRKKVCFEEKAFRLVEKLLDNPIANEFLIDVGKYIDASHYSDVVDERAIVKQCGYPICNNALHNVPTKKYHISIRNNEVYDITNRKKFCSNQCFNASQYYAKQLSSVPVWLREEEEIPAIHLLSSTIGSPGETVVFDMRNSLASEVQQIESMRRLHLENLRHEEHMGSCTSEDSHHTDVLPLLDDVLSSQSSPPASPTHLGTSRVDQLRGEHMDTKSSAISDNVTVSDTTSVQDQPSGSADGVEQMVRDLLLTELLPSVINNSKDVTDTRANCIVQLEQLLDRRDVMVQALATAKTPHVDRRRTASCEQVRTPRATPQRTAKMISALPMEQPAAEANSKPVPKKLARDGGAPVIHIVRRCLMDWKTKATVDFMYAGASGVTSATEKVQLKKTVEMEDYENKVERFLQMSLQPEQTPTKADMTIQSKTPDIEKSVVLPHVDSHAQIAIRRKIVCTKVIKLLPTLLGPLKVYFPVVSSTIRHLVDTFRLTSENITLRPTEWTLLTVILLQL